MTVPTVLPPASLTTQPAQASLPVNAAPGVTGVNAVISIQPVTTSLPTNPLLTLPPGTVVEGFVVNRDAQNNPILRTSLGDVRITSDVFLKTGSEVVFRVDTSQASRARIVTVDGLSLQNYSAQSSHGLTHDTISASTLRPLTAATPTQAGTSGGPAAPPPVLEAIILQPLLRTHPPSLLASALSFTQSSPPPLLAQLAQLRAGTPLQLSLLDLKLPPLPVALASLPESRALDPLLPPRPATTATATVSPSAIAGAQVETASTTARAPQAAVPPPPLSGPSNAAAPTSPATATPSPLSATIAASASPPPAVASTIAPPPHGPSPIAAPATPALTQPTAANHIVANVIGHDADGANILHTAFASLKIYTPQPLPTGTSLLLRADTIPTVAGQAPLPLTPPAPATTTPSALGELVQWLNSNQPDAARELLARLPTPGQTLASTLLGYIAAAKSGTPEGLIGKRIQRLLESNAPEMLSRLHQQFEQLQATLLPSTPAQWSVLPLPLFFGQEIIPAQLYLSKDAPEDSPADNRPGRGQRFILDVSLSQLGPLQLDGFIRTQERSKSFDLMVRSHAALPDEVSNGIRTIFSDSMAATGLRGQVIFQPGSQHFVRPQVETPRFSAEGGNTILA
ncbi:MAG: hypothetical protein SFW64_02005 [Alphaproteobacteria bacterium]|nr:hypothetical protein [Alphaproteobacteria bacterium]